MSNVFHLAFKVKDIPSTREFYGDILGCQEGRSSETWVDFNFFGNQISAHVSKSLEELDLCGAVDGVSVPIPHFGCVLSKDQFERVRAGLEKSNIEFIIKPRTRYKDQAGQQETMFVMDLSGNALEFKSFKDQTKIFS